MQTNWDVVMDVVVDIVVDVMMDRLMVMVDGHMHWIRSWVWDANLLHNRHMLDNWHMFDHRHMRNMVMMNVIGVHVIGYVDYHVAAPGVDERRKREEKRFVFNNWFRRISASRMRACNRLHWCCGKSKLSNCIINK